MQQDKKFLKIYVSGTYGYTGYASWMHFDGMESCLVYNIKEADLLVLPGGGDVSPELYGEEPHRRTYGSPRRDISECIDAEIAIKNDIPIIGTCRGLMWPSLNGVNSGNAEMPILSQAKKEIS
mgnify:CR=1 FL=1